MGSKISNTEWGLVIGFLLMIDAIQAFLDFILIGPFVNSFITGWVISSFGLYIKIRGVKFDKEIGVIIAIGLLMKVIPFLDLLPALTALGIRTMIKDIANKKLKKSTQPGAQPEGGNQQSTETQKKAA